MKKNKKSARLNLTVIICALPLLGCNQEFNSLERQCSDAAFAVANTAERVIMANKQNAHAWEISNWRTANVAAIAWRESVCPRHLSD